MAGSVGVGHPRGRQPELVSGRGLVGSQQVYPLNLHFLGSGQATCTGILRSWPGSEGLGGNLGN